MHLEIKGTVKEVIYKSDKSFIFVVNDRENSEIKCTITKRHIDLSNRIDVNKEYRIKGELRLFRKTIDPKTNIVENIFYVDDVQAL